MAGATSALFVLDIKGRCLISRDYRGGISAVQAEKFFSKLLEKEVNLRVILNLEGLNGLGNVLGLLNCEMGSNQKKKKDDHLCSCIRIF